MRKRERDTAGGAPTATAPFFPIMFREQWYRSRNLLWLRRMAPVLVAAAGFSALPAQGRAQEPVIDSLRAQIQRLIQQVDSLRAVVARLEAGTPDTAMDPLARIRAAAAAAVAADTAPPSQAEEPTFVSRQRNLSALNPEISVTGDIFALARSESSTEDNFAAREFEISFISNLDPFSRAKVFVAHHSGGGEIAPFGLGHEAEEGGEEEAGGHGGEVEIEEGYVEWVNVASGLGLTLGKFRQRFGRLNRWHAHALPAQQYPLPILAFMGEEGLGQAGVSLHWLTPLQGFGTYEIWGELTRSSSEALFGESRGLSALAHVNAFWDLSPSTYLELGLSGMTGDYEAHEPDEEGTPTATRLLGADITLDWRPPAAGRYRQATLQGGIMLNRRVVDGGPDLEALGGYVIGEYKFATQWILGSRYEYTENPDHPEEHAWLAAPSLTWWQSEYVRLRAAYEIFRGHEKRFGQFTLQATFAMGPHKHENY